MNSTKTTKANVQRFVIQDAKVREKLFISPLDKAIGLFLHDNSEGASDTLLFCNKSVTNNSVVLPAI